MELETKQYFLGILTIHDSLAIRSSAPVQVTPDGLMGAAEWVNTNQRKGQVKIPNLL